MKTTNHIKLVDVIRVCLSHKYNFTLGLNVRDFDKGLMDLS